MKEYNPQTIEHKWQEKWLESGVYKAVDFEESRPKYVLLTEFPYPSGDGLHLGHVREYTLGDVMARFMRMKGHNVLFPMAFDAFGLPTENYAIKNGITPQEATKRNIANFQQQFNSLGFSIDWDRSFCTTDPDYYKWTQWIFIQFYKAGLAYQDKIAINWCPKCKTGLANEEVVNHRHERCDTLVEKRELKQWLLKITAYADKLIEGLESLDYPKRISDQQINWIGRSQGTEIDFKIVDSEQKIKVFTTRLETLCGATFLVVAPENELVESIVTAEHKGSVGSYIKQVQATTDIERQDISRDKTGVFTGAYAVNPGNGELIPIWIADYVLGNYGTGALMGVPAHDARDKEFAQKYSLPIVPVLEANENNSIDVLVNSGKYSGIAQAKAKIQILNDLKSNGSAEEKTNYKLHDWIFSRQHYWGEPIPIVHCPDHGAVPVADSDLPVQLPEIDKYEPTDTGESPLASISEWVNTECPVCSKPSKRETDTMPNWAGSSWYYLRYFDPKNQDRFAGQEKLKYWKEVDLYLGGMEHTTLHLLYSRFWHQFLYDQGLVPTPEPYHARRGQGIILAADGTKMSKSKGNVVNPNDVLEQGYGADSLRLAIAFLAPFDQTTSWSPESMAGTTRFLQRVWNLVDYVNISSRSEKVADNTQTDEVLRLTHNTIKQVTKNLENMHFNTAIAALMEFVNGLYKIKDSQKSFNADDWQFAVESLLKLTAPFAPHLAEELWQQSERNVSIHVSEWPQYNEDFLKISTMTIVVQINGKIRGSFQLPTRTTESEVIDHVLNDAKIMSLINKQSIKKRIYIPGKLVSLVLV